MDDSLSKCHHLFDDRDAQQVVLKQLRAKLDYRGLRAKLDYRGLRAKLDYRGLRQGVFSQLIYG